MRWVDLVERLRRATGLTDRQVAAIEKRRAFRVWRRVHLLGTRDSGETINLLARNFGAQGLRVESPVRLRKDEVISLQRTLQPEEEGRQGAGGDRTTSADRTASAAVVWTRRRKDKSTHDVGLSFVINTSAQRKAAACFLIDDCRVGIRNPRENRKAPRIATEMKAVVMTPDCSTSEMIVRDIAVGGLLAISARAIERNTPVDVKIHMPDGGKPLVCKGMVVRCLRLRSRSHELGVAFTTVPDDHRDKLVGYLSRLLYSDSGL